MGESERKVNKEEKKKKERKRTWCDRINDNVL